MYQLTPLFNSAKHFFISGKKWVNVSWAVHLLLHLQFFLFQTKQTHTS